jgi:putative SOS response-associated peptidase YedK
MHLQRHDVLNIPAYNIHIDEWVDEDQFVPRYNIAPHSRAPVLRRRDGAVSNRDELILQTMKWGLIPHWSKFDASKSMNTINARSESLIEGGGMWASIKGKTRCAVVCQGSASSLPTS